MQPNPDHSDDMLRQRHAAILRPASGFGFVIPAVLAALLVYGLWHLGFSFTKFIIGIANLGNFVVLMFPPSWGDQESLYPLCACAG